MLCKANDNHRENARSSYFNKNADQKFLSSLTHIPNMLKKKALITEFSLVPKTLICFTLIKLLESSSFCQNTQLWYFLLQLFILSKENKSYDICHRQPMSSPSLRSRVLPYAFYAEESEGMFVVY